MHSGRCKSAPTNRISVVAMLKPQTGFVPFNGRSCRSPIALEAHRPRAREAIQAGNAKWDGAGRGPLCASALKDHPQVHCHLARIEGSDTEGSICRRGAVSRCRTGEHRVAQAATVVAVILSVIEQIGRVRGNLEFDALDYRERASETQVDVEAPRPSKVAAGLIARTEPKLVGNDGSIWSSQHLALKRAGIVLEEGVLGRGHLQAARERDRSLSVVPVLKIRWRR